MKWRILSLVMLVSLISCQKKTVVEEGLTGAEISVTYPNDVGLNQFRIIGIVESEGASQKLYVRGSSRQIRPTGTGANFLRVLCQNFR